ncbi:MAG: NAD+ synthase [Halobacteriota archaeon]
MTGDSVLLSDDVPIDLRLSESELETTRAHLVSFIREIVDDADADGATLGLSGGIDSTVTAHLAVDALGADDLHGLVMPSAVNDPETMSDAERVAEDLGITSDVIEIQPIAEAVFEQYPDAADDRMAAGNVYVRTRAVLNYFVANHENRIVLGTGNRSEAMTGYFTKYGDQAVDCNPIGGLYKQQVRQLAAYVGVPNDLVMQTPTAGMWVDQTDEAELGLDYDTLDAILAVHIDGPLSTAATVRALEVTRAQVERVESLVDASAHKRSMPPAPEPIRL